MGGLAPASTPHPSQPGLCVRQCICLGECSERVGWVLLPGALQTDGPDLTPSDPPPGMYPT